MRKRKNQLYYEETSYSSIIVSLKQKWYFVVIRSKIAQTKGIFSHKSLLKQDLIGSDEDVDNL